MEGLPHAKVEGEDTHLSDSTLTSQVKGPSGCWVKRTRTSVPVEGVDKVRQCGVWLYGWAAKTLAREAR